MYLTANPALIEKLRLFPKRSKEEMHYIEIPEDSFLTCVDLGQEMHSKVKENELITYFNLRVFLSLSKLPINLHLLLVNHVYVRMKLFN